MLTDTSTTIFEMRSNLIDSPHASPRVLSRYPIPNRHTLRDTGNAAMKSRNSTFSFNDPGINYREIEAFRAVMISGTATGAAVLLHTSQPVISKSIARLQSSTGVKLFELRKSRLVPTPEAQILFRTIERSYVGLEHIGQTLAELRGAHTGRISIGTLPSFGIGILPKIVKSFLD